MSGGRIRHIVGCPAGTPKRSPPVLAVAGSLISVAGFAFCPGAAGAADLPLLRAPVASAPAAIYSWTGFYIGGQVGAGASRSSWSDPFGTNNTFAAGASFLGGGSRRELSMEYPCSRRRGELRLGKNKREWQRLSGRCNRHRDAMDLDRNGPGRRGLQSSPDLRQGRRGLRARSQHLRGSR
jgi:hypothetical protein